MQKWLMLFAVCLFSLGLFSGTPTLALADENQASVRPDIRYTINKGSVLINDTRPEDMKRHWVFVTCDHWAGCYMRCIGKLNSCENLAKTVAWDELYLFSDKATPKSRKEVKK